MISPESQIHEDSYFRVMRILSNTQNRSQYEMAEKLDSA